MEGTDRFSDDRSSVHKQMLFGARETREELDHQNESQLPALNKEVLDSMRPTFSNLNKIALATEDGKNQVILHDGVASNDILKDANLSRLDGDHQYPFRDHNRIQRAAMFNADVLTMSWTSAIVNSNGKFGIATIGALGALHAVDDTVKLSRSKCLSDAALPAAGLVTDVGMLAGAASFLSKNPAIAKYRAPFLVTAVAARLAVSSYELGRDYFSSK